jgi:hypothetical protein
MTDVQPEKSQPPSDTLLIRGVNIPVDSANIEQGKLRFFVDNPRIYSILHADGVEPAQEDIERRLLDMDHVKALIHDIKRDGGLTDPVIVRAGSLDVLEGNSRLAAYRALARLDPIKWARMKCRLLPADLDEGLIFALLGQYHIKGKKDWAAFEQAGFLYRRSKAHDVDSGKLALEIGLSKQRVEHLINTYQFMIDNDEVTTSKWSYYYEYLKSTKIEKARLKIANLDKIIVSKIKSGEIGRAEDIRDRLPVICTAPKALQKFGNGTDFESAYSHAVESGADSTPYKKLASFRQWLVRPEVETALGQAQGETRKKILFELDKLATRVDVVRGKLKPKT